MTEAPQNATVDKPPRAPAWERGERLLVGVLAVGAVLFLYLMSEPLTRGRVYIFNDLGHFHLPLRTFYSECLARGENFNWMPWLNCGFYLHGEGQVGMYHPLHLALYGLLPLTWAFNLEFALSYVFAAVGTYLWLRGWLPRRDVALVGAVVFAYSGFTLGHHYHINAVAVLAHLPWMLWTMDRMIAAPRPPQRAAAALGLGLLTTSEWLLGYPQYVLMNGLAEGVYLLWRRPAWRIVGAAALASVLGSLGGCVQLVPTLESLRLSMRAAPTVAFCGMWSLHPLNFAQVLFPHALQPDNYCETSVLNGLFVGAGLLSLWPIWRSGRNGQLAGFALLLVGVGTFLALGRFNPFFDKYIKLPGMSVFRCPARFVLFVHLAAAVGAAVLWTRLAQLPLAERPSWLRLSGLCALPLLTWACLPTLGRLLQRSRAATFWTEGPHLCWLDRGKVRHEVLWMAGLSVLLVLALRGRRTALLGLGLFILADQYTVWHRHATLTRSVRASVNELLTTFKLPEHQPADRLQHTYYSNFYAMHQVRLVDGYFGLPPRRQLDYANHYAERLAGVMWRGGLDAVWQPFPGLPRARLVSHAVVCDRPNENLAKIDVATTALVSQAVELDDSPAGTATLATDRPGRASIVTEAPARQLLVFNESFHPGWRVTVDGKLGHVVPVYGDFLGCEVPAGRHTVKFLFRPDSLRTGAVLSVFGLVLLLGWFGWTVGSAPRHA